ncbi:MAG: DNA-directed RNA polymerase subunit omega [Candidatus Saccharicenans sp.]
MKETTFDSKFRFIIVAAQRAKQLLKGGHPKIKSKHRNPIRIAQEEVKSGAVQYEILPFKKEEGLEEEPVLAEAIPFEAAEAEGELEEQEAEELEEELAEEELEDLEGLEVEEEEEGGFDEEEH